MIAPKIKSIKHNKQGEIYIKIILQSTHSLPAGLKDRTRVSRAKFVACCRMSRAPERHFDIAWTPLN